MLNLGIDLGTTFSLASYVNAQGIPMLVPDRHDNSEFRTPSVVHIGQYGCLVGHAVENLLDSDPEVSHSRFFKLAMGNPASVYRDHLARDWTPEGLSALVLGKLKRDLETHSHLDIANLVVTVPANFSDSQRHATRQAILMAGLPHATLIEEPVAAATFYGYSEKKLDQTLFVYDLGGGTFDATLLHATADGVFAMATDGRNDLGGKTIDELIMRQVAEEFMRHYRFDPFSHPTGASDLRRFATAAKLALCQPGNQHISRTLVIAGKTLDYLLTRQQFEQLITHVVDESIKVSERCLAAASMGWEMVDKILLTGGSSLLPLISKKVAETSGHPAANILSRQPHQAVAYGAAMIADRLAANASGQATFQLQRIAAYDLGIRVASAGAAGGRVEVLIARHSPVPASVQRTFFTSRDDQTRLVIEVMQQKGPGDDERSLGYFCFGPLHQPRMKKPIEVTLRYDEAGAVQVTARDPESGDVVEQVIDSSGVALNEVLGRQKAWLNELEINAL